jgi:hypothetical protein
MMPLVWPKGGSTIVQVQNDMHDGQFLLADPTSTVDQKLGSILGIEILETATSKASTVAVSTQRERTRLLKEAEDVRVALQRAERVTECEQTTVQLCTAGATHEQMQKSCQTAESWAPRLNKAISSLGRLRDLPALIVKRDALLVLDERVMSLQRQQSAAKTAGARAVNGQRILSRPLAELAALLESIDRAHELALKYTLLHQRADQYMTGGNAAVARAGDARNRMQDVEAEIAGLLTEVTVCPLTGEAHERCPFYRNKQVTGG